MVSEYVVLCDFDGTITDRDVAASIIKEFSTADWKRIEESYIEGAISSRQELEKQFSHVNVSEEIIFDFIDNNIALDPTFTYFLDFCRMNDIPITIVSEGLDFYIDHMLFSKGIDLPTRVNEVIFPGTVGAREIDGDRGNGANRGIEEVKEGNGIGNRNKKGIQIRFFTHHEEDDCGKCGNCKSSFLEEQKAEGNTVIYIGDGRSDFCPAKKADIVFAKRSLAKYLRSENINHNPFNSFSDIVAIMEEFI